ncbi:MAG: twin-arginine translocase TatA/TatE family subunit [Thermomicrobiales bacterium]
MIEGLFQPTHLIIIVIIALIVLGPAKLGDVGGAMGRSVREFKENVDMEGPASAASVSLAPANTKAQLNPEDRLAMQERALGTEGIHATDV